MTKARIHYARVDEFWRKEQKYLFLYETQQPANVEWQILQPDDRQTWLTEGLNAGFDQFLPIGNKEERQANSAIPRGIFKVFCPGVVTARDDWAYNFDSVELAERMQIFVSNYNQDLARYEREEKVSDVDKFVNNDPSYLKWTDRLKEALVQKKKLWLFRNCRKPHNIL